MAPLRPRARPGEQYRTLRAPVRLLVVQATLWSVGALVFLLLNLQYSARLAFAVGITILLGGPPSPA